MNIDLMPLYAKGRLDFKIKPSFEGYEDKRIVDIKNVEVEGSIVDNGTEEYEVLMHITGVIEVKSAINSSHVPITLDIDLNEFVTDLVEKYKKNANLLDILPIIWENILLEIPIRAVNPDDEFDLTSGEGWEIVED